MTLSPIEQLLATVDRLDLEGMTALLAPDVRILLSDGSRATGSGPARELLSSLIGQLRSTAHHVTAEWHQDDAWIAEVEASYELRDFLRLDAIPRAMVVRVNSTGISELHIYGAHEHALSDHGSGEEGMRVGGHWIPPL